MQHFVQGFPGQCHAHENNQQGNNEPRHVFDASMAKGMVGMGALSRQPKAEQGDQGRPRVRQVIKSVRGYGNGTHDGARHEFADEQKHVQANAHAACQGAVGLPHGGVAGLVGMGDQAPD